jgi:hypothetical protein
LALILIDVAAVVVNERRRARLIGDHSDEGVVRLAASAPRRAVVRVYAVQRKPVAAGRGASGLAGRPPGGSSSL